MKVGDLVQYHAREEEEDTLGIIIKEEVQRNYLGEPKFFVEVHWFDNDETTYEHADILLDPAEEWIWVI
jgi:hypothetical protein